MSKLLLRNGRVLDPASGRDEVADVLLSDGVIAAIGTESRRHRRRGIRCDRV